MSISVSSSSTISRWSLSSYPFASAKSRDQRHVRQVGRVRGGRQLCHDARRSPGGKSARRGRVRRSRCIRRPKLYLQQGTIVFHLFTLTISRFAVLSFIIDTMNNRFFWLLVDRYSQGYMRQALYACKTCCSDKIRAAVCLACSFHCHEGHELVELYTKRHFRCDCGNTKFNGKQCNLEKVLDLSQDTFCTFYIRLYRVD